MRARLAVEVGLLLAVLVGVNLLGARHFWRGDFTRTHLYALCPSSRARLAALDVDVEIFAFVLRGAPGASELRGDLDELFERARGESSHLHVRFVDADREPAERRLWAARFRVNDDQLADGVVVVAHGDQWKVLERSDLAQLDERDGERPHLRGWRGEAALVDAIAAVTSGRAPEVCVATGHGEPLWNGTDGDETGFIDALRRHQLAPRAVEVHSDTDLSTCAALVVGSPDTSWTTAETAALARYLDGGGRLLALLGPSFDAARARFVDTGLEPLLSRYGVVLGQSFVVDVPHVGSDLRFFVDGAGGQHPLQRALDGKRLLFDGARPVRALAGHAAVELLRSSPASWGERDLLSLAAHAAAPDATDERGPLPLGVAVAERNARLVVWGSSEIAADSTLTPNQPLLLASIDWLLGRPLGADLPARHVDETRLLLDDDQRGWLLLLLTGLLPLATLLVGSIVYWRRRR